MADYGSTSKYRSFHFQYKHVIDHRIVFQLTNWLCSNTNTLKSTRPEQLSTCIYNNSNTAELFHYLLLNKAPPEFPFTPPRRASSICIWASNANEANQIDRLLHRFATEFMSLHTEWYGRCSLNSLLAAVDVPMRNVHARFVFGAVQNMQMSPIQMNSGWFSHLRRSKHRKWNLSMSFFFFYLFIAAVSTAGSPGEHIRCD